MPTCKRTEELLDLYLNGELDDLRQKKCREHLDQCPNCSRELELRKLEREVIRSGFPVPELSPDFCEQVMKKITSYRERKNPLSQLLNFGKKTWLAPVLTGLLILFAGYGIFSSNLLLPGQETSPEDNALLSTTSNLEKTSTQQSAIKHDQEEQEEENSNIKNLDTGSNNTSSTEDIDPASTQSSPVSKTKQKPAVIEEMPEKLLVAAGKEHAKSSPNRMTSDTQRDHFRVTGKPELAFMPVYLPAGFALERIDLLEESAAGGKEESDTGAETVVAVFSNPQTATKICLEIAPERPFAKRETIQFSAASQDIAQPTNDEQKLTWYAEKDGKHYTLSISGDLPLEELKKVANSLQ